MKERDEINALHENVGIDSSKCTPPVAFVSPFSSVWCNDRCKLAGEEVAPKEEVDELMENVTQVRRKVLDGSWRRR